MCADTLLLAVYGRQELTIASPPFSPSPFPFPAGLDRHTRYEVHTSTSLALFTRNEMSVWRRFSDFEWLHKRLSITYPSAIIPLFPAKRLVGNNEEAFIKDRMTALEAYVDKVAHHPRLNTSLDLLVFLDATDEGLEAAKRYIEAVESEDSESIVTKGVDFVMSIAAGSGNTAPLAIKADEAFVASCAAHGAALARLNSIARTGGSLDVAQKGACDAIIELGRAMIALAQHERSAPSAISAATAAVDAAASAAKRAETVLFTGSASTSAAAPTGGDAAAAAAFNAHAAAAQASKDGSISGMFAADFSDPYSALHAAAPKATGDATAPVASTGETADTPELLTAAGNAMVALGNAWAEQLARLEETLYAPLRVERDREAELGEAIKRRDAAIDKVQEANATLQRKKKALAALKPSEKDYTTKMTAASQAVEKVRYHSLSACVCSVTSMSLLACACVRLLTSISSPSPFPLPQAEAALTARRDELDKMTEQLKIEMDRVMHTRRKNTALKLAEYAKQQAAGARARADAWQALLPSVSTSSASIDASRETISTIARKAEAKARAASAAKAKGGAASSSSAATGGASSSGGSSESGASSGAAFSGTTGAFGDDGMAVPTSASDL
jgi:hypothetical protein